MSLRYIIDACNIIHHIRFTSIPKKNRDQRQALLDLIHFKKLTGSKNNKVTVVFDGYPAKENIFSSDNFNIIFSFEESADDCIKNLLQKTTGIKNIVVVSDDRQIIFFAKASGCKVLSVAEFLAKAKETPVKEPVKPELNFSQAHKINEELKRIWLK